MPPMDYPIIQTIDDLLPHIVGNENFSINSKADYIVVDYILNTPELFKNAWEKECRGAIFCAVTGKILSRPYHKFFNINERPESTLGYDFLDSFHVILEKLDGSMIRPFKTASGRWIWGSKAGETFLTPQIEEFLKDHPKYQKVIEQFPDCTFIFEWCSRKNRIVVDHPQDRLVLTGVRHTVTGNYWHYSTLRTMSNLGLEVVKPMHVKVEDVKNIDADDKEGIVIRFDNGHMVKVKSDKYLRYHRAKDDINREKNVISILVNNQADDFRGLLSPDDRARFERFEEHFISHVGRVATETYFRLKRLMENSFTKKMFALTMQKDVPSLTRRIYFKYLEGNVTPTNAEIYEEVINILKGKVNNQASVDEARQIFHVNWNDYQISGEIE